MDLPGFDDMGAGLSMRFRNVELVIARGKSESYRMDSGHIRLTCTLVSARGVLVAL